MNTHPSDWPQLFALFERIVEAPPGERARLLAEATFDRPDLREHLQRLLELDASGADPAARVADWRALWADTRSAAALPQRIGAWRIVRELGAGGMGRVFLAERADGEYEQQVALKVIGGEFTSDAAVARFLAERRILARLDHPGIASLVDGGVGEDARPWFAMQFVEGVELPTHCRQHALGLEARLRLMIAVCEAVAYAHRQLVVHCDLKPSNVLVDCNGQPRLLDFGIARLLGADDAPHATQTRALTPGYAAPEQLAGKPVGVATDVYALGVMLHELLVGARPSASCDELAVAFAGARQPVEALPPSRAATASSPVPARRLRGDLDLITSKALRHDASLRYADSDALAEDLRRYLSGFPLRAQRDSKVLRARKFIARHRVAVTFASLAGVALLATTVFALLQMQVAREQTAHAEAERRFLLSVFDATQPLAGANGVLTERHLAERAAEDLDKVLDGDQQAHIDVLVAIGTVYQKLGLATRSRPLLTRALDMLGRQAPAASDPRTLQALLALGRDDYDLDDYASAVAHLQRADALAQVERVPAEQRATILYELGSSLSASHQFDQAMASLDRAERVAAEHGANANLLPHIRIERAVLLERMGRLDAAIAEGERALAAARRRYGDDASDTAHMLTTLGGMLEVDGQLDRAETLLRAALAIELRSDGQQQPSSVSNLAAVLQDRARYDESESMYRHALQLASERYGPDSVKAAGYRRDLALEQVEAGHLDAARANLQQVYARFTAGHARRIDLLAIRAALAHVELCAQHREVAARLLAGILADAPASGAGAVLRAVHMDRARLALEAGDAHAARVELAASEAAPAATPLTTGERVRLDLLEGDVAKANADAATASACYRRALALARGRLDPQHPLAIQAMARLELDVATARLRR